MIAVERAPADVLPSSHEHLVLCVDDEPDCLQALRRVFRREPYDLLTTSNPEEALHWVDLKDVSLVISDQKMPTMSGTRMLEGVRERSPDTFCAVLTAYPGILLAPGRSRYGIRALIVKPWDDDELKSTVRRLLRERESALGRPDPPDGREIGGEGGYP